MKKGGGPKKLSTKRNTAKTRKADKIHGQKRGKKGTAAQYVTRAQALKKLQLSLADFRRICILKGIYPRDPKKKPGGADKTYYHKKDIKYLQHEPLLHKFAEIKTFLERHKKLIGRHEGKLALKYEERRPVATLAHLVLERYPSFTDALRDLDDALCTVALFEALPADKRTLIAPATVRETTSLMHHFLLYVTHSRCLRKVFASIKGYYFQAEIMGEPITWLMPHRYPHTPDADVDYRVMETFLDFYRALLKFTNFKLFKDKALQYPAPVDEAIQKRAGGFCALEARVTAAQLEAEDDAAVDRAATAAFGLEAAPQTTIFDKLVVFVQREVPLTPMALVLRSGGARVSWERPGAPFNADAAEVTHIIVDRPRAQLGKLRDGVEYVQPQWVLDSFNEGLLLPCAPYSPGSALPPHLSPFVDDDEEGYVPERRQALNALKGQAGTARGESADGSEEEDPEEREAEHRAKLEAEASGVWASEYAAGKTADDASTGASEEEEGPKPSKKAQEKADATSAQKALMSKKHKRLYQRIEQGEQRQADRAAELKKRAKAAKKKGMK